MRVQRYDARVPPHGRKIPDKTQRSVYTGIAFRREGVSDHDNGLHPDAFSVRVIAQLPNSDTTFLTIRVGVSDSHGMDTLPDLARLSAQEKDALIAALWA